jgi:hypothetical protein
VSELPPIELLEVVFPPGADLRPVIMGEVRRLARHGPVRPIDVLFMSRDAEDGLLTVTGPNPDAIDPDTAGVMLGTLLREHADAPGTVPGVAPAGDLIGVGRAQLDMLTRRLPPGRSAALILLEHHWAEDLRDALEAAGAETIVEGYLSRDAMERIAVPLDVIAQLSAENRRLAAKEGMRLLRVLKAGGQEVRRTVAETLEVLVAAGEMDPAAVPGALRALAGAGLLRPDGGPLSGGPAAADLSR